MQDDRDLDLDTSATFGEDPETYGVNQTQNESFDAILDRRRLMQGAGVAAAGVALAGMVKPAQAAMGALKNSTALTFSEISHGLDDKHHVASGYDANILIRWGDPITRNAPAFNPGALTAAAQDGQFGYNNDFLAYMPLPKGSKNSDHGLLCVNHEYANEELMFTGVNKDTVFTKDQTDVIMAAHGLSVVEIKKENGRWRYVQGSRYNRRMTAANTAFRISGPAAGHARMRTKADAAGMTVYGTLNNCSGGVTPWGTVLSGEENFNGYFRGDAKKTPEERNHTRYGVSAWKWSPFGRHYDRFDVEKEPNEPNRFGWVVEYDPYDPTSTPVKRTALGRIKHEGAATVISADGRVVVYSGDDERFEYIYKFVSAAKFNSRDLKANRDILDEGVLYVARFNDEGSIEWLPLVYGQGPLTATNGFNSQADVLIETRRAADLVGATPMDRPEGIEASPITGFVYAALTNNTRRRPANDANARQRVNASNPRAENRWGHIIEMVPPTANGKLDHAADLFAWNMFAVGGDPSKNPGTRYGEGTSSSGWFSCPDNLGFDPQGRLWITTDGMQSTNGAADGAFVAETGGAARAASKQFFRGPMGGEVCSPCFTPDGKTLFLAVQHPAEDDDVAKSNFDRPATRWPDFRDGVPPRPSVVAITKKGNGVIGS